MTLPELMMKEGGPSPLMSFTYCIIFDNIMNQCAFCMSFTSFESTSTSTYRPAEGEPHGSKD